MRSAKYLPQLKRFNSIAKSSTPGERVISSLFPNRTANYAWGSNMAEQVAHFRNWTYVAVNAICCRMGGLFPNLAYVVDAEKPGLTVKGMHRGLLNAKGRGFGGSCMMDWAGHSYLTMGEWRSKALSVIKPHDDLEPMGNDHPLRRLLENPNPVDTTFDLLYESQMFQELCGVSYIWAVPNSLNGTPCELWVIPSNWVRPMTGGGTHVSPEHPHAGELIEYYEIRPWGGYGASGLLKFPPNEVIMERWKSPMDKIGGWSKLTAGSQWIDTEESISRSRWAQFINQARPEFWLELAQGYEDPDDNMIARIESKFMSRMQGESNYGKPVITPPGAKIIPLSFTPQEMCYFESETQIRDMILSLFQVPKAAVGISENMTFGSVLATLASMCSQCINPRLQMRGQTLTKHLASRWSQPGRRAKLWWDDTTPADPAQVNSDLTTDMQCILPGQELQGRVIGGSKARYTGKAVEIVTRSGAVLIVTPNHPVATPNGFVPAGDLKKGQDILRYAEQVNVAANNDVQHAPSLVENVFSTLSSTFSESIGEVTTSPIDFHGDAKGFNGDIQVVGSYGKLRNARKSNVSKHVANSDLVGFGLVQSGLRGFGQLAQSSVGRDSPLLSNGKLGSTGCRKRLSGESLGDFSGSDCTPSFGTETKPPFLTDRFAARSSQKSGLDFRPIHGQSSGLGFTLNRDAVPSKPLPQPLMADTLVGSDLLDGFSRKVDFGNPLHVEFGLGHEFLSFGSASYLDTPLFELGDDGGFRYAEFSSEVSDGLPGEVTADQIVNVRNFHYDGLVYDFESPLGFIVVNSICVSNCHAITPNEIRALRGRPSYEHGGDDPLVSGPGGIVPLPLNTGEDQQDLADLLKPFTQPEQAEQQAMEGGPLELPEGGEEEQPLALESKPLDMDAGVEEPNGEPSKRIGKVIRKSTADAAVKDLSEYLNSLPEEHKEGLYVWVNQGPPKLAIVDFMDWFDGGVETELAIKSQASKWTGDEQRVIVQNEGGKPGPEWQQVFPNKYDKAIEFSTEKELNAYLKKNNLVRKSVVASGLAVIARDTGRVLMLQRHIDDHRGGTWEFPGGKIEGNGDTLESAKREWFEETGIELPDGKIVDNWRGTNGKYEGFVYQVAAEDTVDIVNRRLDTNPDGDIFEVVAWVSPKDFDNHNLRPELLADLEHLQRATQAKSFRVSNSLKYIAKYAVRKADGGSCKPGERADLTGCTPISGDGGAKTTETPSSAGHSSKVKTAIVDNFKAAAEKFSDVKETMLTVGEIGGSVLPESVQTALVKTYGAVRFVEHKLMTGYNKSREMAETVAIERGLGEEHAKMVGKAVGIADLAVGWTIQAPAILALTGGNVAAAKVGTWIPACSLGYIVYSTARNPMATIRAAKKMISGKKEEPKKSKKKARKPAKKKVKK